MDSELALAYRRATDALTYVERCIITTHVNPDGDAVGSALATWHTLKALGASVTVILPSPAPANMLWMPGATDMEVYSPSAHDALIRSVDTIIVLDLNTLKRLDTLGAAIASSAAKIINIDHHTMPDAFAHIQVVDTDAAATCDMLVPILLPHAGAAMRAVSVCLYTGIMTDTGGFRFPRTTSELHRRVATLIDGGADPVRAYEEVFNQSGIERTRMLGQALTSLKTFYDGRLCVMVITRNDLKTHHCSVDDVEGYVHHTLAIAGVRMGVMIVELDGMIKCSFRSKGDTYVRDLASSFGGGGHVYAAGARIKGVGLDQAVRDVVAAAERYLQ